MTYLINSPETRPAPPAPENTVATILRDLARSIGFAALTVLSAGKIR